MKTNKHSGRMVRFCEHDLDPSEMEEVGGIPFEKLETARQHARLGYANAWLNAHLAVMHLDPEVELPDVERVWRSEYRLGGDFIIVRVTKGGRSEFETEPHRAWSAQDGRFAYILHVRNHEALERDDAVAQAVLSMTSVEAKLVFHENLSKLPKPLQLAFRPGFPAATLSTLSILCQGYLAMHAAPDGKPEGVSDRALRSVANALDKMGWCDLCKGGPGRELLVSELRDDNAESRNSRRQKRDDIREEDAFYWSPLADEANLPQVVTTEWQTLMSNIEARPTDEIKWLVGRIGRKEAIDSPGRVAVAYIALAEALESSDG